MSQYYSAADFSTGRREKKPQQPAGSGPLKGDYWDSRLKGGPSGSGAPTPGSPVAGSSYRRPEGVAVSRVPMPGGVYGSQRMGYNPDAWERFPYGVRYTSATAGTASWTDLTPAYRDYIDTLAKHPNIGSSTSTGRMLWERMNTLAADRLSQGENVSPQMLVAELAGSVGISADLGIAAEQFSGTTAGPGYSPSGGGGYGGGGGGGSVSLTNPTSARGLLMQTMQGVLGRNPSEQEYKQFIKALNEAEMGAPRTVGVEGDLAVQSGGVDPGMVAMEYVEGLEEFDSAAGQRTLDAFMQVLGA